MRTLTVFLCASGLLAAQSEQTTYQRDINGRRVATGQAGSATKEETTERTRSVNGRRVPVEQTTERVLREDANGKVVEKIIHKFDSTGQRAVTERVLVEESKLAGGGKTVRETVSRSDLNGRFQEVERRTSESRVAGDSTTTNVTIDRPNPNGGFVTAERRVAVEKESAGQKQVTETVQAADFSGRFQTVRRSESTIQTDGAQRTENTSVFEPDSTGRLALSQQKVETTTKQAGGDVTETTFYTTGAPGRPKAPGERPRVMEQQVLQRSVAADGSVTEALSVRRANPSDTNRLGNAQKISETVCTGKCLPDPAQPSASVPTTAPARN